MSKKKGHALDEVDAQRRIEFLIIEASQAEPIYDQTVKMALRVLSNFYQFGRDYGSRGVRENCRYRTRAAHERIMNCKDGSWHKAVTNEHQKELGQIWDWMCERKGNVTIAEVVGQLKEWPMVVVLQEENKKLPKKQPPDARYRGIEVLYRHDDGEWRPRESVPGAG
jgi:hypothetical protein